VDGEQVSQRWQPGMVSPRVSIMPGKPGRTSSPVRLRVPARPDRCRRPPGAGMVWWWH
jgi:hypothetical protein